VVDETVPEAIPEPPKSKLELKQEKGISLLKQLEERQTSNETPSDANDTIPTQKTRARRSIPKHGIVMENEPRYDVLPHNADIGNNTHTNTLRDQLPSRRHGKAAAMRRGNVLFGRRKEPQSQLHDAFFWVFTGMWIMFGGFLLLAV
ncbi:hypothetical protein HK100_007677, partial [Physocladia obscura]